jgi:hypothetical protein
MFRLSRRLKLHAWTLDASDAQYNINVKEIQFLFKWKKRGLGGER